jgi:3-dehydroquinate synthase
VRDASETNRGRITLTVQTAPPYDVYVEPGVLARAGEVVGAPNVALISDDHVAPRYAERVIRSLQGAGSRVTLCAVAAGEASKSLAQFGRLLSGLAQRGFTRHDAVLALGGGVVSDLAGFVAASYMRGLAFAALPTSLLAMVDAAVGGKTGINLPEGKNLVGAFWQPQVVLIDPTVLRTLPEREFRGGAVELFKHGLLADPWLLEATTRPEFRRDGPEAFLTETVARSVAVKAAIVAQDEREGGVRAHLNLGHTLAHALEAATQHRLTHGDAVAYGLLFAAHLSAARGYADETARVARFVAWVAPAPLPELEIDDLLPFITRDKKHLSRAHGEVQQRWVLLERVGAPTIVGDITTRELRAAWAALREHVGREVAQ